MPPLSNALPDVLIDAPTAFRRALHRRPETGAESDARYGAVAGAEDRARRLRHRPAAPILTGAGTEGPHAPPLHDPGCDFDDDAPAWGAAWPAAPARRALAA